MLNGRWVESDEIFSSTQASYHLEEVEQPVPETEPRPSFSSRPAAAAPECEEQELENRKATPLKPLRFREVLLSQTDHELSLVQVLCEMRVALCALLECNAALVQVRNEYYEGLQLLQDLLLRTMMELQNYDDAMLKIERNSSDKTFSALVLPLSHSFSSKIKTMREEESQLRKHLVFISETYGSSLQVSRVPSDIELMALAIAKDGLGETSKLRAWRGSAFASPKLAQSWHMYREKGGRDIAYVHRSEEQVAVFMRTLAEEQSDCKTSEYFMSLQEYFYVWLSRAYRDASVVVSTACSVLVALETFSSSCAYVQIAANALENSADIHCTLRFKYLVAVHSLFLSLHNALKASETFVLLDPQGVLNQW